MQTGSLFIDTAKPLAIAFLTISRFLFSMKSAHVETWYAVDLPTISSYTFNHISGKVIGTISDGIIGGEGEW